MLHFPNHAARLNRFSEIVGFELGFNAEEVAQKREDAELASKAICVCNKSIP